MKELALNHLPELAPRTVESLNLLRLRLEQTAPDAKIILLTSTTPQEGKTTLALQFWQLLAGLGQRCLLVDGDLRHSGICRQCGLTGEHKVPGLSALPRYVTVPCLWCKAAALPTRSCARRLTFCRAAVCRCWALC